jgi:diguanylate cyclase (GGDEF)-like protein
MRLQISDKIGRPLRGAAVVLGALAAIALIALLDWTTGIEISLSILYLFPVAFASWQAGLWPGVAVAVVGAGAWLAADLGAGHEYSAAVIPYWNAAMRGIIFLVVGLLLVRLRTALDRETRLATRDALTGIGNWRHFEAVAGRELGRAQRTGRPLSLAYFDLDNFKAVNDTMGHQAGDALLVSMAAVLQRSVRTIDCVARVGGDEFAVLMPDTGPAGGRVTVERIRTGIEENLRDGCLPATLSVGLATFFQLPDSIDQMIKAADDLMYNAKRSGKNSVTELVVGELRR